MKKVFRWFYLAGCVGLMIAGCQPAASPTAGPPDLMLDQTPEQAIERSPLDWLREQPGVPGPPEWPTVIASGLPEGFELDFLNDTTEELRNGDTIQLTLAAYLKPEGDQYAGEIMVEVRIVGSQSAEARSAYLNTMLGEPDEYEYSLEWIGDAQVVRYYSDWEDGRTWVSGPYLVCVHSYNVEERSPWVDAFAELYLNQPPVPVAGTLLDWLLVKPFELAPSERPVVISDGLPQGFQVFNKDSYTTGELPSGELVEIVDGRYWVPPEGGGGGVILDSVDVSIHTFGSAAGRSEYLDMLVAFGDLSLEVRDWGLESFSGGQVARYGRGERDKGRIWISGPYLIIVERGQEEHGDWVEVFTELYLAQYPAE